jgi:hypothetical protein
VQDPVGSVKSQEKIFKVALPVSLEAVFQTSLGFVDQIIVGPSYPNVGKEVLHFTFWGLIIAAYVQPAKVLHSILGNGILPSEGDTKHPAWPCDRELRDRSASRHLFILCPALFCFGAFSDQELW